MCLYINTCKHTRARTELKVEAARPNTSVDALNTAIILCLVGTVGGWRGWNGWRPTICGKSVATGTRSWWTCGVGVPLLANVYREYVIVKVRTVFWETRKKEVIIFPFLKNFILNKRLQGHFENTMLKINILRTVKWDNFALNFDNSQTARMSKSGQKMS